MRAHKWPQQVNHELGNPVRQPGWHRAGALTAAAILGLGLQVVGTHPGIAAANLLSEGALANSTALANTGQSAPAAPAPAATEEGAEVAISQDIKLDPKQFGCQETDSPGIPSGCRILGTLTVQNLGPRPANSVVVTDDLPAGLLNPTVVSPHNKCSISNGLLTCKLDPIPAGGSAQVVFSGDTSPTDATRLTSVAHVEAEGFDPNPADNVAMTSRRLNLSSDLAITQEASTTAVSPGDDVHLTATITNYGPSDAENVRILASANDPLQALLSDISVSAPDGSTSTCDPMPDDKNAARCQVDVLKVGDSMTVTVSGRLRADLPDANVPVDFGVNVAADTFDINPDNNGAESQVTSLEPQADLSIGADEVPDLVHAGEQGVWTFTVANGGPSNAASAKVELDIPTTLTDVVVTSDHGPCTPTGCDLGLMYASEDPSDPGNTAEISVRGVPAKGAVGNINIEATVLSPQADPDPDNTARASTLISTTPAPRDDDPKADLQVSNFRITPLDPSYTGPGSQRRIQFTVTNNGPDIATTTWFRLTRTTDATANLTGDLANNCMSTSRELMCAVRSDSDLRPGESVDIDYPITLGSIGRIGNYTDYVHVYSQTADPDETNNFTQADIVITDSKTDLQVSIDPIGTEPNSGSPGVPASLSHPDDDPSFVAGGNFTYRVGVSVPAGAADATSVDVSVDIPKGFVPVSAVAGSGHCAFSAGENPSANCLLPTVSAGSTTIINISGYLSKQANDLYPDGDAWAEGVEARVSASTATPDRTGQQAKAEASTLVDIIESADLDIEVTPDEAGAHDPGTQGYTVTVLNSGPSGVEHAAITAMLPLGVTLDEDASDCDAVSDLDVTGTGTLDVIPLADGYTVGAPNAVLCGAAPNTAGDAEMLNAGQQGSVHLVVHGSPEALAKGFDITAGSLAFDPNHANNVASTAEAVLNSTGLSTQAPWPFATPTMLFKQN